MLTCDTFFVVVILLQSQVIQPGNAGRHDIFQKNFATQFWNQEFYAKICVNHDTSQFATKEHKCFEMAQLVPKEHINLSKCEYLSHIYAQK